MLITGLAVVVLTLYMLIAGFALLMTYDERCKTDNQNPVFKALSVVACVLWPLTVVTVATVAVALQRKTPAPALDTQSS